MVTLSKKVLSLTGPTVLHFHTAYICPLQTKFMYMKIFSLSFQSSEDHSNVLIRMTYI